MRRGASESLPVMAELGVLLLSYVAGTLLPVLSDAAKSVGGVHLWQDFISSDKTPKTPKRYVLPCGKVAWRGGNQGFSAGCGVLWFLCTPFGALFLGVCPTPLMHFLQCLSDPPFGMLHRDTDTQIPRDSDTQIPRDPDVQDVLPPHQRVDLVFGEPVPWRADPASLDGFGDECWGLLSEFSDLLVCELVFGEVGETSGFMW